MKLIVDPLSGLPTFVNDDVTIFSQTSGGGPAGTPIAISSTPPPSPSVNDLWVDTS